MPRVLQDLGQDRDRQHSSVTCGWDQPDGALYSLAVLGACSQRAEGQIWRVTCALAALCADVKRRGVKRACQNGGLPIVIVKKQDNRRAARPGKWRVVNDVALFRSAALSPGFRGQETAEGLRILRIAPMRQRCWPLVLCQNQETGPAVQTGHIKRCPDGGPVAV